MLLLLTPFPLVWSEGCVSVLWHCCTLLFPHAGIIFVGGFSYADVLDSAKGWAGTIRCNARLWEQFTTFYNRQARGAHPEIDRTVSAQVGLPH